MTEEHRQRLLALMEEDMPYSKGVGPAADYRPIRKVFVFFLGAAVAYGAKQAGLDLGPEELNEGLPILVGAVLSYLERDPRVVSVEDAVQANAKRACELLNEPDPNLPE